MTMEKSFFSLPPDDSTLSIRTIEISYVYLESPPPPAAAKTMPSSTTIIILLLLLVVACFCSSFPVAGVSLEGFQSLRGVRVKPVNNGGGDSSIDIGEWLSSSSSSSSSSASKLNSFSSSSKSLLVFGTYAADFNAIEYGQRLRYYWPKLKAEKNVTRCAFILNSQPEAAKALCKYVDLPIMMVNDDDDDSDAAGGIAVWADNTGEAGRRFGVCTGWLPDNANVNPFLKLFGMLWGLGAWATLPAVIGGYIGNPFVGQPWIQDALAVGQRQGRWPDNALEISSRTITATPDGNSKEKEEVIINKFDELPLVGDWPRRPLELATLRLQSMLGISLQHWKELAPDDEAMASGVLTQLGGCLVTSDETGQILYEYRDPGICAVANFETMLKKL
jgi:AhpC/TSA antioxidant enzyme